MSFEQFNIQIQRDLGLLYLIASQAVLPGRIKWWKPISKKSCTGILLLLFDFAKSTKSLLVLVAAPGTQTPEHSSQQRSSKRKRTNVAGCLALKHNNHLKKQILCGEKRLSSSLGAKMSMAKWGTAAAIVSLPAIFIAVVILGIYKYCVQEQQKLTQRAMEQRNPGTSAA